MAAVLIGIGIAVAIWLVAVIVLVASGRRSQARELAKLIPDLLMLFPGLLRDPRVPRSGKLWLAFAVVWIASPIYLIPEFIPIAGPLDDAIVAALVLRHLLRRTSPDLLFEHWRGDPATLEAIMRWGASSSIRRLTQVVRHQRHVPGLQGDVRSGCALPIPTSAPVKAGASLTQSPTMAMCASVVRSCRTVSVLSSGCRPARQIVQTDHSRDGLGDTLVVAGEHQLVANIESAKGRDHA